MKKDTLVIAHEKTFGEWLQQHRKEQGFTLAKFARKVHIDQGHLSRIENDRIQVTLHTVYTLFKGFDMGLPEMTRAIIGTQEDADDTKLTDEFPLQLTVEDLHNWLILWVKEKSGLSASSIIAQLLSKTHVYARTLPLKKDIKQGIADEREWLPWDSVRTLLLDSSIIDFSVKYPGYLPPNNYIKYTRCVFLQKAFIIADDIQWYIRSRATELNKERRGDVDYGSALNFALELELLGKVKLREIIELDSLLQENGRLVGMFFLAKSSYEQLIEVTQELARTHLPPGKDLLPAARGLNLSNHLLSRALILLILCRWRHYYALDHSDWLAELREKLTRTPV